MIDQIKTNIKKECKKRGLTIQEICSRLHKDRHYIYRMTDEVKMNKLISIAQAIGCNVTDLLHGI